MTPDLMHVWQVTRPGSLATSPLKRSQLPLPMPAPGEVLVRVSACGVCRTDLHVVMGDLPTHRSPVTPGHEVVGRVVQNGTGASRFQAGERIGIAWLRHTCGVCRFCNTGRENLCLQPRFTGWDDDGGYAEYATVPEEFAYRIPEQFDDVTAAPLLCAGIIGFRALERASLPAGGRIGLYGFGASAHLAAQIAMHRGATVHVLTRSAAARRLALELGCASAGDAADLRPSASTRPSCSPQLANSFPSRCRRSTAVEHWRLPASISATCRRSTISRTSSRSVRSAASRPTRALTARGFLPKRLQQTFGCIRPRTHPPRPTGRWQISGTTASTALRYWTGRSRSRQITG